MAKDILDAVYGCMVGGAIGDAMGAPVEMWHYRDIRKKYGKVKEFMPSERWNTGDQYGVPQQEPLPPGRITDDCTYRHYIALAIIEKGGRITPTDLGKVWNEKVNPRRLWLNETIVHTKIHIGMNPWESGKGTCPTGCATMAISPIGIINAGNPAQAFQDGFNIAFVNQDGVNRDCAATLAAGIAAAFIPGATADSVIEQMMMQATDLPRRAIELAMDLAAASSDCDEFTERFYESVLMDWTWEHRGWTKENLLSGSSTEILPAVAGILKLCDGRTDDCIIEGAAFGRDNDTISSIAGELAGAMEGASAINPDWVEFVEEANADFFVEVEGSAEKNFRSVSERLVGALEKEREAAECRRKTLEAILGR